MSNNNKLVFFNKKGYPYNFRLNDNNEWYGKIFFEPGSTDIYKSLTIYTLESVDSIELIDTMDIINNEIYNTSGMTISKETYDDQIVTDIKTVNQSSSFYSKWIFGTNFQTYYPVGTVISFTGNYSTGSTDFNYQYFFVIIRTKKDAFMIATTTDNDTYLHTFNSLTDDLIVQSYNAISLLDTNQTLDSSFNVDINQKISIVGSTSNDGVYEIENTGYTYTRIFDYDLSSITSGSTDSIRVDLELLTERPLLYSGNIELEYISSILYMTFIDSLNSNLTVGSTFICENVDGEHLINGNEYTIQSIITGDTIGTTSITFSGYTEIGLDGLTSKVNYIIAPKTYDLNLNDDILFTSLGLDTLNNGFQNRVIDILTGDTESTTNTIYLSTIVHDEINAYYKITKIYKSYEQTQVIVTSSIDNSEYVGFARCMSITNILTYNQDASGGVNDALNNFVYRYENDFNSNGVDIYKMSNTLVFEGMYSGQNPYFNIKLYLNNVEQNISNEFSDSLGNTFSYQLLIKDEYSFVNERKNMSYDLDTSYSADIILDIFDDAQDFGFELLVNGIQYYISFNDNSGTTSYTNTTIDNFIFTYGNIFNKNGLDLTSGITSGSTNHLYVNGQEPNVNIWEMSVKVNRNSSYTLAETGNTFMMLTYNKIYNPGVNFIQIGFTTGMILSIADSRYGMNNAEYNIIGIDANNIELSYQGPMKSDYTILLSLKSREYLRRPRESNDRSIYYRYRWEDDINKTMFLFDLSGDNLVPWGNNINYTYTGVKPLVSNNDLVILNTEPNKNKLYITIPYKQQTIFDQLDFELEKFDDDNISILPRPIETFIGYQSTNDSFDLKNLIVERVDNIVYSGYSNGIDLFFTIFNDTVTISGSTISSINLLDMGFKTGRYLRMKFDDLKSHTQGIFENYTDYLITNVTKKTFILSGDTLITFSTEGEEYNFEFLLLPERIGLFSLYAETEAEDERLEANLKLLGIDLTVEDEYIFKHSDVTEHGIDYRLLNKKRKEMLNIFPEIYNYIGSYKAILHTIDFFGYNDVQLTEYYRNLDPNSPYFNKLKRVVIPDIIDREIEGWSYSEDLAKRVGYTKTNLLNLTYRITDEEGNNVYLYTLQEVQIKLNGLKNWMRRNVIPINSNIRDITGVSETVGTKWRRFDSNNKVQNHSITQTNESINFNYKATHNFNDSWLVSVSFYTVNGSTPASFDLKIITYKKDATTGQLYPQERYDVMKTDMKDYNFEINWVNYDYDSFFYIETKVFNDYGLGKSINKMYKLKDGNEYYVDEYKNYTLINNNFIYKTESYVQDLENVYIIDDSGNIYVIKKETA